MNTTILLPEITNPQQYREIFRDGKIWDPVFTAICKRHQLSLNLKRSEQGSHIVYRAGDSWIKLMAPIYEKEMMYEVAGLRSVHKKLSVATPEILFQDSIEGWPYVVLTDVPGESIKYVWPQLSNQQQMDLVLQMADILKQLSRCQAEEIIINRFSWNEFINVQYDQCDAQQSKKRMPLEWLKNVKPFLNQFSKSEFQTENPVYLHCDLSYDHFHIAKSQNSAQVLGIIDMADAQVGHREYELAAPCVFFFKGQRALLRAFLENYGIADLNQRFSEKLLAWCLLHRYFDMYGFFTKEMDECTTGDFKALAQKVFPLRACNKIKYPIYA